MLRSKAVLLTCNSADQGAHLRIRCLPMPENLTGDGFEVVRPAPGSNFEGAVFVDDLVPEADWFWHSLQWYCVPDCCGLDAYDFSETAVRRALGQEVETPDAILDWSGEVGDVDRLIAELTDSAGRLRGLDAPYVSAARFNHFLAPAALADLFLDLADKLRAASA